MKRSSCGASALAALPVRVALRCLGSPLSLAAIALLLANDHLLKRVWPSWLTGKLSDVAGLYFTPYLLLLAVWGALYALQRLAERTLGLEAGALPQRAVHLSAALVFAATGAFFASLKLPPTARVALRAWQALLGRPAVVVVDPTDLVALGSLLPAYIAWRRQWAACRAGGECSEGAQEGRLVWQLALLAVATMGIMATSPAPRPCLMVNGLAADPQDPLTLYATKIHHDDCNRGYGSEQPDRRLFISHDAGDLWQEAGVGGERILPDPLRPGILYLVNDDGLWRYDTASGEYTDLHPPLMPAATPNRDRYGLGLPTVAPPWRAGVVYVGVTGAVARSNDGGATWTIVPVPLKPDEPVDTLAAAPSQPGLLYATQGELLYRSDDWGDSWHRVTRWVSPSLVLQVHPTRPDVLLAGTEEGIRLSEDGGRSWKQVWRFDSILTRLWSIRFDPVHDGTVYAAAGNDGLLVSTDGGRSWRQRLKGKVTDTAIAAGPGSRLYVAGSFGEQADGVYHRRSGFRWFWQDEWEPADRGLGQAPSRSGGQVVETYAQLCVIAALAVGASLLTSRRRWDAVRGNPWAAGLALAALLQAIALVSVLLSREPHNARYGVLLSAAPALGVAICLARARLTNVAWLLAAVPPVLMVPVMSVWSAEPGALVEGYVRTYDVFVLLVLLPLSGYLAWKGRRRGSKAMLLAAIVMMYWWIWLAGASYVVGVVGRVPA